MSYKPFFPAICKMFNTIVIIINPLPALFIIIIIIINVLMAWNVDHRTCNASKEEEKQSEEEEEMKIEEEEQ